uniref:Protein kinase domain-containing protein n=1 Tax=Brassica oleracea var. oleracea TaxID=109376 RepID=A0A0D3EG85_BRAOL
MKTTKSTDYPQQMGNGLKSCKQKHTSPLINTPLLEEEEVENLRIFSVEELKKATNEFKIERVVEGEDTYVQKFYKGYINETTSKLPVSVMEAEEEALPWGTRVKIATGIAQGVAFIHSIKNSPLHQELRMHNILLDEQYNAKLLYLDSKKQSWPEDWTFAGTIYKSPENMFADILGMETDVYIFGVILLELFTGSKEILIKLNRLRTSSFLFTELIDPRLGSDYPVNAATNMGTLVRICTVVDRKKRPLMQQVADVLNSVMCRGT